MEIQGAHQLVGLSYFGVFQFFLNVVVVSQGKFVVKLLYIRHESSLQIELDIPYESSLLVIVIRYILEIESWRVNTEVIKIFHQFLYLLLQIACFVVEFNHRKPLHLLQRLFEPAFILFNLFAYRILLLKYFLPQVVQSLIPNL